MTHWIGDIEPVHTSRCDICKQHVAMTGSGELRALTVRGAKRSYIRWICDDCVALFNTTHWRRTRKLLHMASSRERAGKALGFKLKAEPEE